MYYEEIKKLNPNNHTRIAVQGDGIPLTRDIRAEYLPFSDTILIHVEKQ